MGDNMTFSEKMKTKAKAMQKKLVLPEALEPRTLQAARIIVDEGLASEVFLVGKKDEIAKAAQSVGADLTGVKISTPDESERLN